MANIIQINNTSPESTTVTVTNVPPNAPLDFGSLTKMFTSLVAQSTPPSSPNEGDVYLDDGTNTASGKLGLRRYNGTAWEDFGLQGLSGVTLGSLGDVNITSVTDGDRLVYDAAAGEWKNQNTIDGGHFT